MRSLMKCCLGYMAFNNYLSFTTSISLARALRLIRNYTVTLRTADPTDRYYRFKLPSFQPQAYDAFLVLDFEANIAKKGTRIIHPEIIEFPCLWVNASDMKIIGRFHKYVRPVFYKNLHPYCTQLTGITSEMLRKENDFAVVFSDFLKWFEDMKEKTNSTEIVFITVGDWDLQVMLPKQCRLLHLEYSPHCSRWINIKKSFQEVFGRYPKSLKEMLIILELKRYGRLHRGMDDTVNTYHILKDLADRGHVFHE